MAINPAGGQGALEQRNRFLDPKILQRIGNLELVARGVVEGFLQGLHRSPFLGQSMDFAEHRPYVPGDDPRRVDWKAYAKTERYYVKEFEAETNTNFTLLLDCSSSMNFGEGVTKFDYARFLSASLAYMARKQGDRVGIMTFDSKVRDVVPCSGRHLDRVLMAIARSKPEHPGNLSAAIREAAMRRGRKGIMAIVSDLYLDPEELRAPLTMLREVGNDVMVFQILTPPEMDLPYEGPYILEDIETGEVIPLAPKELLAEYRTLITEHVAAVARVVASSGADHILAETSRPLDQALFHYLLSRQYRKRSGRWASHS